MNVKNKTFYLIRHCEAEGQDASAELTKTGIQQAKKVADFFSNKKIDLIIASPYQRAIQSILPLAQQLGYTINTDKRLKERIFLESRGKVLFSKILS
ncbi:MAG: histidine phosphatase family protein [Bacillus sp. (in: firmicutes)]